MMDGVCPDWLNDAAMGRLVARGVYAVREIFGVDVAEPKQGRGPAYAQDVESGWWQYIYDVLILTC